ncbi:ribosomal protein S5 domain 2-type protein [Lipomyces oligophaga]|uniref:ribosomal protein S5 domain 2-type protein n=1 Tax=Lipomyces oligophaga TaxID=45792 RepID=UPI0034CFAAD7
MTVTNDIVPSFSNIHDIYSTSDQTQRYRDLFDLFKSTYGTEPAFVSRSPGRVNLIGEHIDYCFFSVLPMAVESDIVIAVKANSTRTINLTNLDPQFEVSSFELSPNGELVTIDKSTSAWSNYFKCGHLVAHQYLKSLAASTNAREILPVGMDVVVSGTVPAASGLSSSAAFICAAALATLKINNINEVTKKQLTEMAIVSERHLGVFSGGMDQSASVYGERDHALYVQFKPQLTATPFKFPTTTPPLTFLIANSLIYSNKHDTAPTNYNLRVVEVSLAAEILAHKFKVGELAQNSGLGTGTLRGFMEAYFAKTEGAPEWTGDVTEGARRLLAMKKLVLETFTKKDGYTKDEAAAELGVTVAELELRFLSKTPVVFTKLQLYGRSLHVYEEALRVLKYLTIMLHPPADSSSVLYELGALMSESHKSLALLFNASCPELDTICEIAKANGSTGSRVTGAGFGGCSVHLVPADKVQQVRSALIDQYYKVRFPNITAAQIESALVASKPGVGSLLYIGGRP